MGKEQKMRGKNLFEAKFRFKRQIMNSGMYKDQKKYALMRAGYKCEACGKKVGDLAKSGKPIHHFDMHHLLDMQCILDKHNITTIDIALQCPELFDYDNVQILCQDCHKATESYGAHSQEEGHEVI